MWSPSVVSVSRSELGEALVVSVTALNEMEPD
jgi:hypothetical protein